MAIYKCAGRKRPGPDGEPLCAYEADQYWYGRCPSCGLPFDCLKVGADRSQKTRTTAAQSARAATVYLPTGVEGFDHVIGGGLVKSSVILFGGSPGAGKSSLMLAVCDSVATATKKTVLYGSGEENEGDVLKICNRLKIENDKIEIMGNATDVDEIIARCEESKPVLAVFDSLQVITAGDVKGGEGSPSQGDAVANIITGHCKRTGMCAVIINHVTKLGEFKGTTEVAHLVDTVVMLDHFSPESDGDPEELFGRRAMREINDDHLRTLMVTGKNRNGSSGSRAYFLMTDAGVQHLRQKSKLEVV